jgi:hypothetical protein
MARLPTREIVARAIHRLSLRFRPELPPEPPKPPPQPPPLPPPPPGGGPPIGRSHESQMQRIYARWNGRSLTEYLDWRDLFEPLETIFDVPGESQAEINREKERYWDMFLRAFKLTTHDRGHIRRETFYNRTGIPRSQIDWSLWRDIMGYSNRRGH